MEAAILKMLCFKASPRSVSPPHFRLSGPLRRPVILVSLGLAISKPRSWFSGKGEECGGTDLDATHFLVPASVTNRSAA